MSRSPRKFAASKWSRAGTPGYRSLIPRAATCSGSTWKKPRTRRPKIPVEIAGFLPRTWAAPRIRRHEQVGTSMVPPRLLAVLDRCGPSSAPSPPRKRASPCAPEGAPHEVNARRKVRRNPQDSVRAGRTARGSTPQSPCPHGTPNRSPYPASAHPWRTLRQANQKHPADRQAQNSSRPCAPPALGRLFLFPRTPPAQHQKAERKRGAERAQPATRFLKSVM